MVVTGVGVFQYGMRALLWAAWFGHRDAVRVLVNSGATVNCVNKVSLGINGEQKYL